MAEQKLSLADLTDRNQFNTNVQSYLKLIQQRKTVSRAQELIRGSLVNEVLVTCSGFSCSCVAWHLY